MRSYRSVCKKAILRMFMYYSIIMTISIVIFGMNSGIIFSGLFLTMCWTLISFKEDLDDLFYDYRQYIPVWIKWASPNPIAQTIELVYNTTMSNKELSIYKKLRKIAPLIDIIASNDLNLPKKYMEENIND